MTASGSKSLASIGFLTVREHSEGGLLGGYLAREPVHNDIDLTEDSRKGASELVGYHAHKSGLHLIEFLKVCDIIEDGYGTEYLSRSVLEGDGLGSKI